MNELEEEVNKNRQVIQKLDCKHASNYASQEKFHFLLGHRSLILKWSGELMEKNENLNETIQLNNPCFSPILVELIRSALTNRDKTPNARRFSDILMQFSVYLYIMAGKSCYEIISSNLPIPKSYTIMKHIYMDKDMIIEGALRCEQLAKHLELTNSPKSVFISEDGSGIVQKVTYDSRTNQMIGLVLPFNEIDGMPRQFSFKATSEESIRKYMEQPQSTLVYIIVAQPLKKGAPPFILQMFGTNNKFEAGHILKRWRHTVSELKK